MLCTYLVHKRVRRDGRGGGWGRFLARSRYIIGQTRLCQDFSLLGPGGKCVVGMRGEQSGASSVWAPVLGVE